MRAFAARARQRDGKEAGLRAGLGRFFDAMRPAGCPVAGLGAASKTAPPALRMV